MSATRRLAMGGTLVALATLLLLFSLVTPWWTTSMSGCEGDFCTGLVQAGFLPGGVQTLGGDSGSASYTYQALSLNHTADLYTLVQVLIVVGVLVGLATAMTTIAMGVKGQASRSASRTLQILGLVVLVATLGAVAILPLAQPAAIAADLPSQRVPNPPPSSPSYSFWGACSREASPGHTCGAFPPAPGTAPDWATWGAGAGWYMALAAGVLMIFGLILIARSDRGRSSVGTTASPAVLTTTTVPASPPQGWAAEPPSSIVLTPPPPPVTLPQSLGASGPVSSNGPAPPPLPNLRPGPVGGPSCPRCGAPTNAIVAGRCTRCGTSVV